MSMVRRTIHVGLRLTRSEWRVVAAQRRRNETVSDVIRRLILTCPPESEEEFQQVMHRARAIRRAEAPATFPPESKAEKAARHKPRARVRA
jgi:hypothetical protein